MNNEEESVISSLFTKEELAQLNFSEEELDAIEDAELICQANDIMPDSEEEMDAFYEKVYREFPPSEDIEGTYNKFLGLAKTDPKFLSQIIAVSALIDQVTENPPPKTEKISLDELKLEKEAISNEEKQAKFARIDAILNSIRPKD